MDKWQKVYASDLPYRAEIVKGVLAENDLNPVLINKKDTVYQIGNYEVHVAPEDVLKAIKIIKDDICFE
jgi:hypothetical protein